VLAGLNAGQEPAPPAPGTGTAGTVPQAATAPGGVGGTEGASPSTGRGVGGSGAGASSAASLLDTLQRRLAWSAARCAPAAAVHLARHGVPGVPLHFCLDASGKPSGVGLLGTTGSDQLDRAARDCVVPGALPLPPAQGCYTVEVRFPIRG
jgi:outer membrane biosynthesis protein TonB